MHKVKPSLRTISRIGIGCSHFFKRRKGIFLGFFFLNYLHFFFVPKYLHFIFIFTLFLFYSIEHDASATRMDAFLGSNYQLNKDLLDGLVKSSSDGKFLTLQDYAHYQVKRQNSSIHDNPEFNFGLNQKVRKNFLFSFW